MKVKLETGHAFIHVPSGSGKGQDCVRALQECPTHGEMESGRENGDPKARPIPPHTPPPDQY